MLQYFKRIAFMTIGAIALFVPQLVLGQGGDYTPISPGGQLPFVGNSTDFNKVIGGLFRGGVTLAALLAVTMLIVGGVQYMGSDSIFAKDEGKKRIMSAIGGLLIALCSILIMGIIFGFSGDEFKVELK
jgi:undecaprenyl pyrophosphate phosphatase UppP